jgi:hypothetical protein
LNILFIYIVLVTDRPIISRRLYSETDNDEDQSTESSRILPSHERRSYGASYASSGRSKGKSIFITP